jgi:hypothetical protein
MASGGPFSRYPRMAPNRGGHTRKAQGLSLTRRQRKRPPPVILTEDELINPSFIYGTTSAE